MPAATFDPITIDQLLHDPAMGLLLAEYAQESSIEGLGAVSPQFDAYLQMEAAGFLHAIGARVDGDLVGFVLVLVVRNPHYGRVIATTESFFVALHSRSTGAGMGLLRAAERLAAETGAIGLLVSAPIGGQLAKVLEAKGSYRETNRVFFRGFAHE
ncbi:acetyltransferase domain containing protein [uncultured Caudovirales phage]|uniref:Acetyltransferase domain containing protein n=1 Tax=uncultured Caudovirales phage TaxID=2100421 RepID=A0A6J5KPF8_9CAUD|nr:acetyltransferase domain containing protein [uncultured Caudovirales phage]